MYINQDSISKAALTVIGVQVAPSITPQDAGAIGQLIIQIIVAAVGLYKMLKKPKVSS